MNNTIFSSVCRLKRTFNPELDNHSHSSNSQTQTDIADTITAHLAKDMCLINNVAYDGFIRYAVLSCDRSSEVRPVLFVKCGGETEMIVTAVEFFITITELFSSRRVKLMEML